MCACSDSTASDVTGVVGTEIAHALKEQGISYRPGTTVGVSGLQEVYQRQLAGTADTEVVAENQAGVVAVLKKWEGQQGTPVRTTIDAGVQEAADRALAGQGEAPRHRRGPGLDRAHPGRGAAHRARRARRSTR